MNSIEFFVAGVPRTKGSTRSFLHAKTHKLITLADNKHLAAWQDQVAFTAVQFQKECVAGPVHLTLEYILPRPKGHYNAKGILRDNAPLLPITKPDVDKLERAILDSLTGIIYRDDAQVVGVNHQKRYVSHVHEPSGVRIQVSYP